MLSPLKPPMVPTLLQSSLKQYTPLFPPPIPSYPSPITPSPPSLITTYFWMLDIFYNGTGSVVAPATLTASNNDWYLGGNVPMGIKKEGRREQGRRGDLVVNVCRRYWHPCRSSVHKSRHHLLLFWKKYLINPSPPSPPSLILSFLYSLIVNMYSGASPSTPAPTPAHSTNSQTYRCSYPQTHLPSYLSSYP